MQFSEDEIQNLKEIFDLFDKNQQGSINAQDLEAIMQSLQRDPQEAREILQNIRREQNNGENAEGENQEGAEENFDNVTFDEFIQLMQ